MRPPLEWGSHLSRNVAYVLQYGPEVMAVRAPVSTLGHLAVSCVWGYAYGLHQQSGYRRHATVIGSLVLAAALHGLFNTLVLTSTLAVLALAMVIIGVSGPSRVSSGDRACHHSGFDETTPLQHARRAQGRFESRVNSARSVESL